jgi:acetoin utilization protein AcuB
LYLVKKRRLGDFFFKSLLYLCKTLCFALTLVPVIAQNLINSLIPTLQVTDSVANALDWMQENGLRQLPLLDEAGLYAGLMTEQVLQDADEFQTLNEIQPDLVGVSGQSGQHLMEIAALAKHYDLDIVPILDEAQQWLGSIATRDLALSLLDNLGVQEPGALLVLALEKRDFAMSEIARLIEANDTKIIGSFFTSASPLYHYKDTLTLKLNRSEIESVVRTLERYEYEILATYAHAPLRNPDQERLASLLRYLEI